MLLFLTALRYSFAVQLLVVHAKKNVSLLLFWCLIFGVATGSIGMSYGAPYTILDPEYRGSVSFWSFWWIGVTFGFFVTTWHLACYMLNSFRFPFLATSRRPFLHFCINNSLIPLAFVVTYIIAVTNFQIHNEFTPIWRIPVYISGFLGGLFFTCVLFGFYFHYTNHDIQSLKTGKSRFGGIKNHLTRTAKPDASTDSRNYSSPNPIRRIPDWEQPYRNPKIERVDNYINASFRIRATRNTEHYTETALNAVFQQHHTNAFLVQIVAALFTLFLGFAADNSFCQIPAAASLLLIFVIIVSLMGAFTYWLTAWRTFGIIVLFLILNQSAKFDFLNYNTPAYGLNYDTIPALYSDSLVKHAITDATLSADRAYMLPILEKWKQKAQTAQQLQANQKPVMVLLNFSGGGSRAMLWSHVATQHIDSLLNGSILDHTFLMTGASGGMLGAAYLRELYYKQYQNTNNTQNPTNYTPKTNHLPDKTTILANAAKDFLNPVFFTGATNDLFFPFRTFQTNGYTYRRTRAFAFEQQYHANTDSILANQTIANYRIAEQQAQIPLLIVTPTVVSNGKKIIISPHPVSYLCRPTNTTNFSHSSVETDGIELSYLSAQNGYNLLLSSAIRMNATYPFILPDTYLPMQPAMQIMDAGFRDNHGFETTFRFLLNFDTWINENVEQVLIVFIRSDPKDEQLQYPTQSYTERYFKPLQAFISTDIQDFQIDFGTSAINRVLNGKLHVINLEYTPTANNQRASMSLHLTTKEKYDLKQAIYLPHNQHQTQLLLKSIIPPKNTNTNH